MAKYTWAEPLWYRGYRIYEGDYVPFSYTHNDFDGAPDSNDRRYGHCNTIDECIAEIDDMEDNTPCSTTSC